MAFLLRASKVVQGSPEIVMDSGQVIIGRLPSNHLAIPGNHVEPIHALIEVDYSTREATVTDLASESGVKVNGKKIEVIEKIKYGDLVQIGEVVIQVLDPASEQPTKEQKADKRKTVAAAAPMKPLPRANISQAAAKHISPKVGSGATAAKPAGQIFQPGKEKPSGHVLEVVAYWDHNILDVRHYGGKSTVDEEPRSNSVYIGNEEDGHIIGVGPQAKTRNYRLAKVDGGKTKIYLSADMRAKVRRGNAFDKVQGASEVTLSSKEIALIKHGPINYFLMNVSLPSRRFPKFADIDGRPIAFLYALIVWAIFSAGIFVTTDQAREDKLDNDPWATQLVLRTPTPTPKAELPAPKPVVEVKKPEVTPPKVVTPKPVVAKKETPVPKVVALEKPKVPQPTQNKTAPKMENKATDRFAGRKTTGAAGNSGGAKGGTAGAFAGRREGKEKSDNMGVEDGKKNTLSGVNLDQLGAGLGKTLDLDKVGAVATGLKSAAGGEGRASGSGARGSHGFGGLGNQSSLSTGGPARALSGLGGGAGGLGSGGLGGNGGPGGGRIQATSVDIPEGDPVVEGSLTREEIEAVIRANLAQIKACYERNLQGNRGLQGRVLSKFSIGTDGRVDSSGIESSTLNHRPTESCIAEAIKRWKFPIPRGNGVVHVRYPFILNPRG